MSHSVDRQVADLIAAESASMVDFVAILVQEQSALTGGELDDLAALAERKAQMAATLSAIDDQRLHLLGCSTSGTDAGLVMTNWLQSGADSSIQRAWQALLDLAARARDLNATNGKLIAERMRHNQQALAVLLDAGGKATLYGPDGQPRLSGGGRPLGSA